MKFEVSVQMIPNQAMPIIMINSNRFALESFNYIWKTSTDSTPTECCIEAYGYLQKGGPKVLLKGNPLTEECYLYMV